MLQWEHSAILPTFIKLRYVIRIIFFVVVVVSFLSFFDWPLKTGFTVTTLAYLPTRRYAGADCAVNLCLFKSNIGIFKQSK